MNKDLKKCWSWTVKAVKGKCENGILLLYCIHFRSATITKDVCVIFATFRFNSLIFIFPVISTLLIGSITTERRLLIGWRQTLPPSELAESDSAFHFLGRQTFFPLFRTERGGCRCRDRGGKKRMEAKNFPRYHERKKPPLSFFISGNVSLQCYSPILLF